MPLINIEPEVAHKAEPVEAEPDYKPEPVEVKPEIEVQVAEIKVEAEILKPLDHIHAGDLASIYQGDCSEVMATFPESSLDAIVTDPPYGLKFMSKKWDNVEYGFHREWADQALRILKPGGHLISFSGSRTYQWLASAIEDAGFEIRTMMVWLYGQGMPHGMNVGKKDPEWEGWHTEMKPGLEPMVLARKPFAGSVVENLHEHGVGALNIDATRIDASGGRPKIEADYKDMESVVYEGRQDGSLKPGSKNAGVTTEGRFPANVILDPESARLLDEQTGTLKSGKSAKGGHKRKETSDPEYTSSVYEGGVDGSLFGNEDAGSLYGDSGGASRFFYNAKAAKSEREKGLIGKLGCVKCGELDSTHHTTEKGKKQKCVRNDHPTVKPVALMEYLVRLVTPPEGMVLDPFLGSGTTGIAAVKQGFHFVGIEKDGGYLPLAEARIADA